MNKHVRNALIIASVFTLLAGGPVWLTAQPLVRAIPGKAVAVDPAVLQRHVRHLSRELYPRSFEQFENLERAASYIEAAFRAAGGDVSVQEVQVQGAVYKNVSVRFGPRSGPLLVIGAHYDSFGDITAGVRYEQGYAPDTHTPGADDNASGVAGLLALAELLEKNPPRRAVELVAFTLEEPPHFWTAQMGSAWHAQKLRAQHQEVELMISLEMIGYFQDAPDSQGYPFPVMRHWYGDRGNFIALVGRLESFAAIRRAKALMRGATDLPVHSINAPTALPGIAFSDHQSYWTAGYPALMVTDTAFFRNPHYHGPGDTHDTLNYVQMAKFVQGVHAIAQNF